MLRTIKTINGFDISSFRGRFTVFVLGEELAFDTMPEAEHFILSGEAQKTLEEGFDYESN